MWEKLKFTHFFSPGISLVPTDCLHTNHLVPKQWLCTVIILLQPLKLYQIVDSLVVFLGTCKG